MLYRCQGNQFAKVDEKLADLQDGLLDILMERRLQRGIVFQAQVANIPPGSKTITFFTTLLTL